jgi:hypothetical protein
MNTQNSHHNISISTIIHFFIILTKKYKTYTHAPIYSLCQWKEKEIERESQQKENYTRQTFTNFYIQSYKIQG